MIHSGHISAVIHRLRTEKVPYMPRTSMAERAGISVWTIQNVERGKDCTMSTLFAMLDVLEISPVEFFKLCEKESL